MSDRQMGTVKWFNDSKGFGFIERESGEDVFVHFRSIRGDGFRTRQGARVEFSITQTDKGFQAEDVDQRTTSLAYAQSELRRGHLLASFFIKSRCCTSDCRFSKRSECFAARDRFISLAPLCPSSHPTPSVREQRRPRQSNTRSTWGDRLPSANFGHTYRSSSAITVFSRPMAGS